jgi:hypothetical protein
MVGLMVQVTLLLRQGLMDVVAVVVVELEPFLRLTVLEVVRV